MRRRLWVGREGVPIGGKDRVCHRFPGDGAANVGVYEDLLAVYHGVDPVHFGRQHVGDLTLRLVRRALGHLHEPAQRQRAVVVAAVVDGLDGALLDRLEKIAQLRCRVAR